MITNTVYSKPSSQGNASTLIFISTLSMITFKSVKKAHLDFKNTIAAYPYDISKAGYRTLRLRTKLYSTRYFFLNSEIVFTYEFSKRAVVLES